MYRFQKSSCELLVCQVVFFVNSIKSSIFALLFKKLHMSTIETNSGETESLYLRIKKLAESPVVTSSGKEFEGLYELTNKLAEKYLRDNVRGCYHDSFRYYVVGLKMEDKDYTVKLTIGVKNGYTYYDHALTPIEIHKLLGSILGYLFNSSIKNWIAVFNGAISFLLSEDKDSIF